MASNENQRVEYVSNGATPDDLTAYLSAGATNPIGVTRDKLDAYIRAGVIKPVGNGVFVVEGGASMNAPRYLKAEYGGDGYVLTAIADGQGGREAAINLDNGLSINNRKGLIGTAYSQTAPIFGGTGSMSIGANSAGQKSIGVNFSKKF